MITPESSSPRVKQGSTWCLSTSRYSSAVAGEGRVHEQDVGLGRDGELGDRRRDVVGRPAGEELDHEEHEHDADPEDRGGVGDDAEDPDRRVAPAVAVAAGQASQRKGQEEREQERTDRQRERGAALVADDVDDLAVVGEGGPEVPTGDIAEVLEVLDDERAVDAESVATLRRAPPR